MRFFSMYFSIAIPTQLRLVLLNNNKNQYVIRLVLHLSPNL